MSIREAEKEGHERFDIVLVSGDAYVDHPLFCTSLIGRVLEAEGYAVGVIAQPDWRGSRDFTSLGKPELFFGVTSGNVDSMVNHFTPSLRRRRRDVYSPAGQCRRPDRAAIVYAERLHALYPDVPIVIGGIEASLRRFAHYDYWSDSVRQSILADAPADILVYGMGERQVCAIAKELHNGREIQEVRDIPGTSVKIGLREYHASSWDGYVRIGDYREVAADRKAHAMAFAACYREQDPVRGKPVIQLHPKVAIVQLPPASPLEEHELDRIYELPFTRGAHPSYNEPVPALEPVRFSVVSHRGCIGECAFCALVMHQGRIVQSRSISSIVREVERIAKMKGFRGVITDVGGPSANMYGIGCRCWRERGACKDRRCIDSCPNLDHSPERYLQLLRAVSTVKGVRKVFVGSGIRFDLCGGIECLRELCRHHVSGHLKVAPEHIVPEVTRLMGKPHVAVFERFVQDFESLQPKSGRRQYLLPYFISGHPGCTIADMIALAEYIRDHRLYTEQVQDFTPTPMTASTVMYHTGLHPFTLQPVHVPKGRERAIQRAILQYRDPRNHALVREGLQQAGRQDLIGHAWQCLAPPAGDRRQGMKGRSREGEV